MFWSETIKDDKVITNANTTKENDRDHLVNIEDMKIVDTKIEDMPVVIALRLILPIYPTPREAPITSQMFR